MRRIIFITMLFAAALPGAVVLDRVAVVVGKRAIKLSDIERDIRVTAFLNKAAVDAGPAARRQSAERLVDQTVIRDEIATGDYDRATDEEAAGLLNDLRRDRFGGSDARLRQELAKYGVTEEQIADALGWQLTVLRFIEERFRPAVLITDDAVKEYYNQHLDTLRKQNPKDSSFETLEPKIREQLASAEVDKQFDAWLAEKRKDDRVTFRQEVFQ
ncbi:MAG TPA: hypothetical protein VFT60_06805 [Bryobacteraceae bacterium]|jgi:hypothetical protein|nr:hypothetical protein [Bryobacteraceae bacterium]